MNDFNLGDQIKNTVQDAVDSMNFDHLNKNITDSVNSAISDMRSRLNINSYTSGANQKNIRDWKVTYGNSQPKNPNNQQNNVKYNQYTATSNANQYQGQSKAQSQNQYNYQYNNANNTDMWERRKQAAIERAKQMRRSQTYQQSTAKVYQQQQANSDLQYKQLPIYAKRVPGRVIGPTMKGLGYSFGTLTGIGTVTLGIVTLATGSFGTVLAAQIVGAVFLANVVMGSIGSKISNRVKRFRQYVSYIGDRKFCQIESLAAHTGYSKRYLIKDIRKMMRLGMFQQAHLDEQGTCLILDHETYKQYQLTNAEFQRRKEEEKLLQKEDKPAKNETPEAAELRKTINEGKSYIRQITEANAAIPDIEISEKLSRLEQITSKIFSNVEQHPEQLPELRRFMEYYLPITLKLVNAYKELDAQPVQGENITNSKKEIVKTLDTINYAFENLLDSLYESTAMDVSSDISVLEALFAQDGLTNNKDFDMKK